MAVTSCMLCANWIVNTAFVHWTGENYPVWMFLTTDYTTAFLIIFLSRVIVDRKPHLWQVAVCTVFVLQMICHVRVAISPNDPWVGYYAYYFLSYSAWLQLAIVGVWTGHGLVAHLVRSVRGVPHPDMVSKRDRGSGK